MGDKVAARVAAEAAGVPTELMVVPGAYHGFDGLVPNAPVSLRFKAEALAALKRGLGVS